MYRTIAKLNMRSKIILIALSVLIGISNTYVPLPIVIEKDLSVPFPCQDKGCGCADAQQCWASCCCHTDLEKLAWAKRNRVAVPSWFLAQADLSTSAESGCGACCCSEKKSKPQPAAENDTCCCESSQSACCCSTSARKKTVTSCCQNSAPSCCCSAESDNASEPERTQTVLLTIKEQRGCQGGDENWVELDLKPVPLDTEPVSYSVPSQMLCSMEPSFLTVWPNTPEPIPE